MKDKEGYEIAINSANRTTGVVACGTLGFLAGGPAGAVAGGILGGNVADGINTAIDSYKKDKFTPSGNIATIDNIINGKTESKAGDAFDLAFGTVMDGFVGQTSGEYWGTKIKAKIELNKANGP